MARKDYFHAHYGLVCHADVTCTMIARLYRLVSEWGRLLGNV